MAQVSCTMYNFRYNHALTQYKDGTDYQCGGCMLPGDRRTARYSCSTCNFNLHDYCAACPDSISTFMHCHELTLFFRKARPWCDLCGSQVEGMYYGCTSCEFNLHPICSRLPERVLHRDHPLMLQNIADTSSCLVCAEMCSSWHYRCDSNCSVGVHIACIAFAKETTSRSLGTHPATTPYHPAYGGGYASPANVPPGGVYPPSPSIPWNGAPHYYNFQAVARGSNQLVLSLLIPYCGYCSPHYGVADSHPQPQPQLQPLPYFYYGEPQPQPLPHPYYGVPQMNSHGTQSSEGGEEVPAQGGEPKRNKIGAIISRILGGLAIGMSGNFLSDLCFGQ